MAGVPISDIKSALKELRKKKKEDWKDYGSRDFRHYLEKKFKLSSGDLSKHRNSLGSLVDQVEDEYTEEKLRKKKEADKRKREAEKAEREKEKKAAEEEKSKGEKGSSKKSSEKPKRKRDSSEERPHKKSKRRSSSESDDRRHKPKHRSKPKKDLDNPDVRRIERLKKVIRGCGVPITGFHKDMSNDRTIRKLKQIIADHESDGMRENMNRSEMLKVRSAIEAQREVDELKRIPKKLQISGRHPRKVHRNKISYDTDLPKTGLYFLDKDSSSSESESSSTSKKKDPNYSSRSES
jgi:hypothetical protein